MQRVILPGATIGVLGSGQLGRMFTIKARRMGYRVWTYSPDEDTPTGQVADMEIQAEYLDLDMVRDFARNVDVITFEFENVPSETTAAAAEIVPVRPKGEILHVTQNRLREKRFLEKNGFPVVPFAAVQSAEDLRAGLERLGTPAVLKTAGWGYDGKGQVKINALDEADAAWDKVATEAVLEGFIDFAAEGSVLGGRGMDGAFAHYGLFENIHKNHILDITLSPSRLDPKIEAEAVEIAHGILEALDVVGVLCVEFFITRDGKLLVNELAPRPHNSGHVTFDNCVTSQFEQQLRAVCGLPLGTPRRFCPGVMVNLLGDLWATGEPDWAAACSFEGVKLHLYGKAQARPGRKMGHLTALADDTETALRQALAAREALLG
ncbi:MAG: 5-(carboxyamino)imidazole ribonucleotide synthase [Candidatus Hydrogenedentes bacterium]|nr:5-(carboxyamino)imidazole ribonucleotide synthase [Candidatus Hydrogenedentota bacterium]